MGPRSDLKPPFLEKNFCLSCQFENYIHKAQDQANDSEAKKLNSAVSIRDAGKRNKEICFLK